MKKNTNLNIFSLTYMKLVRIYLKSMGSWPTEVLNDERRKFKLYQSYRWYMICQISAVVIGQIFFIWKNFATLPFSILGEVYAIMFLGFMTLFRSTLPLWGSYGNIINKFVKEFHLIHFKCMGGRFEMMYTIVNRLSHYFTILTVITMVGGMSLFNISPIYNNLKNGVFNNDLAPNITLQFSIKYALPGFDENNYFILSTCMNYWFSYGCSVLICANDLLLMLMVFQIIGHIKVLNFNLQNIPQPKPKFYKNIDVTQYSADENKMIHEKIVACVNHHRIIVSFVDELSEAFGTMLATNYLYHLVGCCLLLLECSTGESGALVKYGLLTVVIFCQLIQISVIFEILGTKSEGLIESVYSVPWESMDVRNQRSVCILLHRVQTPMYVTALGLTTVGVQTMLQILKTTISYFAFLRSKD